MEISPGFRTGGDDAYEHFFRVRLWLRDVDDPELIDSTIRACERPSTPIGVVTAD